MYGRQNSLTVGLWLWPYRVSVGHDGHSLKAASEDYCRGELFRQRRNSDDLVGDRSTVGADEDVVAGEG